jgi:fibronectin type 3 domain-containing protein
VTGASSSEAEFTVTGMSFPVTIPAGYSTNFSVVFAPTTSGPASANITFASNASGSSPVETASGSGTPPPQHSAALSWNASTSSDVVGYNIYRGTVSGGPYTQINSALDSATTDTDNTVAAGQTYYYVVTSVDSAGAESSYSNQTTAVIPTP